MSRQRTISIKVTGKVQGVWFRAATRATARDLELHGFVQNLPDGTVYIEAAGDADRLERLVAWCHEGPELARVEQVDVQEINTPDLPYPFKIRRPDDPAYS